MRYCYLIERLHKCNNTLLRCNIGTYTSMRKAFAKVDALGDELDGAWSLSFDKTIDESDYLRSTGYTRNNEIIVYRVYRYALN